MVSLMLASHYFSNDLGYFIRYYTEICVGEFFVVFGVEIV